MGLFTKILLLIIAQIAVIIGCLTIHLDDFKPSTMPIETAESKQLTLLDKFKSYIKEDAPTVTEPTLDIEEKKVDVMESIQPEIESDKTNNQPKTEEKSEILLPKKAKDTKISNKIIPKEEIKKELPKTVTLNKKVEKNIITDKKVKALFEKKKLENISTPRLKDVTTITTEPLDSKRNQEIEEEISQIVSKNGIIFKRLSTDVTTNSIDTIKKVAEVLKNYPTIIIEVGGHTDAKGDDKVNAYISKHRALSVKKILIKFEIDENRLRAKGYGESMPIVKNDPRGYSIKNRRVEFKIVKE